MISEYKNRLAHVRTRSETDRKYDCDFYLAVLYCENFVKAYYELLHHDIFRQNNRAKHFVCRVFKI